MSAYINTATNEFPVHEGDIRLLHPEIGANFLCPEGFAVVEETAQPQIDEITQYLSVSAKQDGDRWVMEWTVKSRSAEATDKLRAEIDARTKPYYRNTNFPGTSPDVIE